MNLDLCCGPRKPEGFYGIDSFNFDCVDKVHDLDCGIPLPNDSCDIVRAHDAIEHLHSPGQTMSEIWRVLKDEGLVDILVPSTDGRGAFQDGTHVSFWNENSFGYWVNSEDWMDYYRFERLFELVELSTTPMSQDRACHVIFKARAVKNSQWIHKYNMRNQARMIEGEA